MEKFKWRGGWHVRVKFNERTQNYYAWASQGELHGENPVEGHIFQEIYFQYHISREQVIANLKEELCVN